MDARIKKVAFLLVLTTLLIIAGCSEEKVREHGELVDISEYQERFVHEEWDLDTSITIDEQELAAGIFESADINNDDFISNNEWGGLETYLTDNKYDTFNEWDLNNDGRLDEEEFKRRINDIGLFKKWDVNKNNRLEKSELSKGFFDAFDTDNDGLLDTEEYGNLKDYQSY